MSDLLDGYRSFLFVAMGAAPGAVLRIYISKKFYFYTNSQFSGILVVNLIATFLLGLCLGLQNQFNHLTDNQPLFLILCVGFLGSLSTFSSLILELFSYSLKRKWVDLLNSLLLSLILGIIVAALGYHLVNE